MLTVIIVLVIAYVVYTKFFDGETTTTHKEHDNMGAFTNAAKTLKSELSPVLDQVKGAGVAAKTSYTDAQKAKELERIVTMLADNPGLIEQATAQAAQKQLAELVSTPEETPEV